MGSATLNHVSICAQDAEESIRFYEELFGAERLPAHNVGVVVKWLRIGDLQLHVFERPGLPIPAFYHFGLAVDDFPRVYEIALQRQIQDRETFGHHIYEIPSGQVQLYIKDPAGNLVEVNAPDVSVIGPAAQSDIRRWTDTYPQGPDNMRARLFLEPVSRR
jgi:lactoylglutathione lyase